MHTLLNLYHGLIFHFQVFFGKFKNINNFELMRERLGGGID